MTERQTWYEMITVWYLFFKDPCPCSWLVQAHKWKASICGMWKNPFPLVYHQGMQKRWDISRYFDILKGGFPNQESSQVRLQRNKITLLQRRHHGNGRLRDFFIGWKDEAGPTCPEAIVATCRRVPFVSLGFLWLHNSILSPTSWVLRIVWFHRPHPRHPQGTVIFICLHTVWYKICVIVTLEGLHCIAWHCSRNVVLQCACWCILYSFKRGRSLARRPILQS